MSALFVGVHRLGLFLTRDELVTQYQFCGSPLKFAECLGVEAVFCLPLACEDAEDHLYKESGHDRVDSGRSVTLESSGECALRDLGQTGEGIKSKYLWKATTTPLK